MGPFRGKIFGFGINQLTVGSAGKYRTLQAALNAVVALGDTFDTVKDPWGGVITFTQDSKTVTGDVNTYFVYDNQRKSYISAYDPTTNNVKWYPIRQKVSEAEILLDVPYQEATVTTSAGSWWFGNPVVNSIAVLNDISEDVYISSDGTTNGSAVPSIAINIVFENGAMYDGAFMIIADSGVVAFNNIYHHEGRPTSIVGKNSIGKPVFDLFLFNTFVRKLSGNDFVWFESGEGCGRCFIYDSNMYGVYDLVLPEVRGRLEIHNSTIEAVPASGISIAARGISAVLSDTTKEAVIRVSHTDFISHPFGTTAGIDPALIRIEQNADVANAKHDIEFCQCNFIQDASDGVAYADQASFMKLQIEDSDITFRGCQLGFIGNPTIGASWTSIDSANASVITIPNRVHLFGTSFPKDVASNMVSSNVATINTMEQCSGRSLNCTVQTIDNSEFDLLRADTFILNSIDADKNIPVLLNPVEGQTITFIIQEDATAGHIITWDVIYHFARGGWANSTLTTDANKMSTISFKFIGTAWYETTAANVWTA